MDSIREKENALFKEWQNKDCYSHSFVFDGVVDPLIWEQQDIHILFLLKEAHGESWKGDLRTFLANGGKASTWNNITRWACGILTGCDYAVADRATDNRSEWLRKVAVVNVKKAGGGASTNTKAMKHFNVQSQGHILLSSQLSLYDNLDFIICCGNGIKESLEIALREDVLKKKWNFSYKGLWFSELQTEVLLPSADVHAPVIINYKHPQSRSSSRKLFSTLMQVVTFTMKQTTRNTKKNRNELPLNTNPNKRIK